MTCTPMSCAKLDWSVGQILAKLRELDLDRKTLVVFTSDNGPSWGGFYRRFCAA